MGHTAVSTIKVITKNHKHPGESKTRTHRLSKRPDDGDPWAPNTLLTPEQKEKQQLDPDGPSNRQEAPARTN